MGLPLAGHIQVPADADHLLVGVGDLIGHLLGGRVEGEPRRLGHVVVGHRHLIGLLCLQHPAGPLGLVPLVDGRPGGAGVGVLYQREGEGGGEHRGAVAGGKGLGKDLIPPLGSGRRRRGSGGGHRRGCLDGGGYRGLLRHLVPAAGRQGQGQRRGQQAGQHNPFFHITLLYTG